MHSEKAKYLKKRILLNVDLHIHLRLRNLLARPLRGNIDKYLTYLACLTILVLSRSKNEDMILSRSKLAVEESSN